MQDAMDPDFLKNLASLGPVRTRKPMDEFDTVRREGADEN